MIGARTLPHTLLLLATFGWRGTAEAMVHTGAGECAPDEPLPAEAYLDRISTGWRPLVTERQGEAGPVDEVANARIIFETFTDAGYSPALAFAAIVTAQSESALDNTAVMNDPFEYGGKAYPTGTGAVGLFQLLPSTYGAGGPSGIAEGYSRDFQDGKFAGTREQAQRHGVVPDALGRRYYDATDPRVNTERILLEVERDGFAVLAADGRGASIAELTDLFGRDIERPQGSTWYRRKLAADMLGPELAYAEHPNTLFLPRQEPWEVFEALAEVESEDVPVVIATPPPVPEQEAAMPLLGALAVGLFSLAGLLRKR